MTKRLDKLTNKLTTVTKELQSVLLVDADKQRKMRNGRLMKLGIAVEQAIEAGDVNLLARMQAAMLGTAEKPGIAHRAVDKRDFYLGELITWFDEARATAERANAERGGRRELPSHSAPKPASPPAPSRQGAPTPSTNGAAATPAG